MPTTANEQSKMSMIYTLAFQTIYLWPPSTMWMTLSGLCLIRLDVVVVVDNLDDADDAVDVLVDLTPILQNVFDSN